MSGSNLDWPLIAEATLDTLLMTGFSLLFTVLIGLPVGIALFLTGPNQFFAQRWFYQSLSFVVNVLRSVPFLIFLIVIFSLPRFFSVSFLWVSGAFPSLGSCA